MTNDRGGVRNLFHELRRRSFREASKTFRRKPGPTILKNFSEDEFEFGRNNAAISCSLEKMKLVSSYSDTFFANLRFAAILLN